MTFTKPIAADPSHVVTVFSACDLTAIDGANLGDAFAHADDLIMGDVYMLTPHAKPRRLSLIHGEGGGLRIAPDSRTGRPGAVLHLDACATLMGPNGVTIELLTLVELDPDNTTISAVHVMPLARLEAKRGYALVALDRAAARTRFAHAGCVSFTRGTRITLSSGRQVPVEDLAPDDMVLTRDNGPQRIRWIGQQTVRAQGAFAPIRIGAGTLNNDRDLVVSPNNRLFIYQRRDRLHAGRAEVLVKAKYLLNDSTVTRTDGGFVDYFQLLFDRHEIIYAEGIATESLLADARVGSALPDAVRAVVKIGSARGDLGLDLPRAALSGAHPVDLLRGASARRSV